MLANIKFRHTTLAQSVRFILNVHDINKFICSSMLLSLYFSPVAHAESISDTSISSSLSQSLQSEIANTQQKNSTDAVAIQPDQTTSSNPQHVADLSSVNSSQNLSQQDSEALLQQQEQAGNKIEAFKPIEFEDLQDIPETQVDANMANEIFKWDIQSCRNGC